MATTVTIGNLVTTSIVTITVKLNRDLKQVVRLSHYSILRDELTEQRQVIVTHAYSLSSPKIVYSQTLKSSS
jgi:hypothetical protein